ncbi:MAG: DegQ family serine endoprotease [Smithellaceae bacterium]|nr:DegQ family serine endoprotease [Smithellaceae bacterium]
MNKDNKSRKTFVMFLVAFLVAFFIISLVEVLRSTLSPIVPEVQSVSAIPTKEAIRPVIGAPSSFADLVDKLKPAVVNISTTRLVRQGGGGASRSPLDRFFFGDEFFEKFFGDMPRREHRQRSLGSGFIISSDGYIFTNYHVVAKVDKILVKLSDGKELDATVVGHDEKTDIALIKIKPGNHLPFVELGDSDAVRVGEWALAIGNPFGLDHTVTAGIISAKGRVIGAGPYDNFIQTDASINPGNSGGPLFNMEGKVIGINTAIVAQGQGIGFAIPAKMAKDMLPDLRTKGKVTRGWLGISVQDLTEDLAKSLNIKDIRGALVADVFKGDPAEVAGIIAGDVVIEINGLKIKDAHELLVTVAPFKVGVKVELKVLREGKERVFTVTIAERKDRPELVGDSSQEEYGLAVGDITPEIAQQLGVSPRTGVVIVEVMDGSPAQTAGLRPKDIIVQVDKVRIGNQKEYIAEMAKLSEKRSVMLSIRRGKQSFFVVLRR